MSTNRTAGLGAALAGGTDRRSRAGETAGTTRPEVMASARVPADVWKRLKIMAVNDGVPAQVIVRRAFEEYLDRHENKS
jgi:hypothetical protein